MTDFDENKLAELAKQADVFLPNAFSTKSSKSYQRKRAASVWRRLI